MATNSDLYSLHRYFISANSMRHRFDEMMKAHAEEHGTAPWDSASQLGIEPNILMSYWYAGLYVVVEGWQELKLNDSEIDQLLTSPNVKLLKRYRHGVCHFQRKYHDDRFLDFISAKDAVPWVRQLNAAIGRFFMGWLKAQKATPPPGSS